MALYLGSDNISTSILLMSSDGCVLRDSNDLYLTTTPTITKRKLIINNIVYRINIHTTKKGDE